LRLFCDAHGITPKSAGLSGDPMLVFVEKRLGEEVGEKTNKKEEIPP
jgi:hypothetical protein